MKSLLWLALSTMLAACQPQERDITKEEGFTLAQNNGCFSCHEIGVESYGPQWRDVATKYRGDGGAETYLADKIANGGSGVWGEEVMPPHPQISEADRRALAKFVLSLK